MARGRRWRFWGAGLDRIYPAQNENLARRIKKQGAVISEFPIGTRPYPENFPQRNRIISGLSRGVIVVEAQEQSGALITAGFATEQGREVFAVPSLSGSQFAAGSNKLIDDGAKAVQEIGEVLEEFPYLSFQRGTGEPIEKDPFEARILTSLEGHKEGKVIEILMKETKLSMAQLAASLMILETRGSVVRLPGNIYAKP